jgi:hypothetical protein
MQRRPVVEIIDAEMALILRTKSGHEKLRRVDEMNQAARELIESAVRNAHPSWPDAKVQFEVARRIAGDHD